jgi:hypothetical protein
MSENMSREVWLINMVETQLRPYMLSRGFDFPQVHVSVGWPSARGLSIRRRVIGQCWAGTQSADQRPHIFISPLLTGLDVSATLLHELGHASTPGEGHKGPFVRFMKAVGLIGKPTATLAGEELTVTLQEMMSVIGDYPHSALDPAMVAKKKQGTRLIKVSCSREHEEYIVRMSKKTIERGLPTCICGASMEAEEPEEITEGDLE